VAAALAATPAAHAAAPPERCGAPIVADGQPALVVIVADGIGSQELESGTSDPLTVRNWCPALPDGGERHFPPGIEVGLRTWAGLATPDGAKPQTLACRPEGGLATDECLVARLADAGAIILPYSYTGALVTRTASGGSAFAFSGYTPQDSYQDPVDSIARLDGLVASIATAWPSARVLIVAHSYGGTVASGWWMARAPGALAPVTQVFTLDSPVNGIEQCAATAVVFSPAVSQELCRRWNGRDAFDLELLSLNAPQTLTTIGTPDDPTYEDPLDPQHGPQASGGGRLRPQVLYRCPDAGVDPASACIAAPPSVVNTDPACAGRGPGIHGRTGHFAVIACPNTTRTILPHAVTGAVVAARVGGPGVARPAIVRVGSLRVTRVRWSSWGAATARGRGIGRGGRRVSVVASRLRPCDRLHRFAYGRLRVAGGGAVARACPRP